MALVNKLEKQVLGRDAEHKQVRCTYSFVMNDSGARFLQLDTYGSVVRKMKGKKSQSIRLSQEAISQLIRIAKENGF